MSYTAYHTEIINLVKLRAFRITLRLLHKLKDSYFLRDFYFLFPVIKQVVISL